ncbi:hypothetical protein, partial [Aeromonas sp. sif2433]|uniref:hypothetical protein n=1 Tax=Aeromonas sp. sif2433 TaxID=2854794 RepID=UPI001C4447A1
LAQAELWEERQQVLKGLGIHDGGPRVMTYFKVSLSTCNWDRAFFIREVPHAISVRPGGTRLERPPGLLRLQPA